MKVIVGIRIMHEISQHTVQVAQKHALQSLEDGKSVEEVGKHLQNDDLLGEEIGQSIKESGKTIQEKSQEFLGHTQQLASDRSTEVFSECVQAHIDVNQSHIEAVREFQKGLQTHLRKVKKSIS